MMERRTLLVGGVSAMATTIAGDAQAKDRQGNAMLMSMKMTMKDCIDLCWASHVICLETATGIMVGDRGNTQLAAMLTDCAEICQATASSMIRPSALHGVLCAACAEACDRCAAECEKQRGSDMLARCVVSCRRCAVACRHMAAMAR